MNNTTEKIENLHKSVLLTESLDHLDLKPNGIYIDATLGLGGHSEAILNFGHDVRVVGIDQDLEVIEFAKARLGAFGEHF